MDEPKTPTITVESDSLKDKVEEKTNSFKIQQGDDVIKITSITVIKEFPENDEDSCELMLKRKIEQEYSADSDNIVASPSKKLKKDSKDNAETPADLKDDIEKEIDTVVDTEEIFSLLVSNFPETWSFQQICNYITQSVEGVSVEMEPVVGSNKNELRLTFNSAEHRLGAQNALQNKQVDDNKLDVILEGPVQYDNDSVLTQEISSIALDIWDEDPKGLYGLKPDYLKTLNISPPIGNWVHVSNFRCDKSELRDAFELAGNIVACSIVNKVDKYAKVMYSHPLEAVQAVSMLHDQLFYGKKLKVTMDKSHSQYLLPKGLLSVGPGLGDDGYPVRDVAREYERFLDGKNTKINLSLFTAGNINGIVIAQKNNYAVLDGSSGDKTNVKTSVAQTVTKSNPTPAIIRPSPPNKHVRSNFGNVRHSGPHDSNNQYRYPNSPPIFRGPMHRGPMLGPMGEIRPPGQFHRGFPPGPGPRMPMPFGPRHPPGPVLPPRPVHLGPIRPPGPVHPSGPINPRAVHPAVPLTAPGPGASPNWANPQPARIMPQMSKCLDATALKISNLPPTTSFPSLCGKLSTLAQVTSLEFTTPGCAVVKFASPSDADKCFQNYRTIELF